jgi:outer membrane lipoprotein-sorting protein
MNRRATFFFGGVLLPAAALFSQSRPAVPLPGPPALQELQARLDALKDVKTLETRFVCEKRLALLDSPLVSSGRLWIRKDDARGTGGAVRFSTEHPYLSELILADGKVFGRSQHEKEWTTNNQSTRPGLSAVMVQLGGWSTGDAGKITDFYAISRAPDDAAVPAAPEGSLGRSTLPKGPVDFFVLTPTNKDLAAAVKRIELAIHRQTSQLVFIEIASQQDDATRYWFFDAHANAALPPDLFKPGPAPPATAPGGAP